MSESLREKSNKRILVLANNDVGLYRFRKDLIEALLKNGYIEWSFYALSWAVTILILLIGMILFSRVEKTFMDTV